MKRSSRELHCGGTGAREGVREQKEVCVAILGVARAAYDCIRLLTTSMGLLRTAETEPAVPPARKVSQLGAALAS